MKAEERGNVLRVVIEGTGRGLVRYQSEGKSFVLVIRDEAGALEVEGLDRIGLIFLRTAIEEALRAARPASMGTSAEGGPVILKLSEG